MFRKFFIAVLIIIGAVCTLSCGAEIIVPKEGSEHPYVYLSEDFISSLRDSNGELKPEFKGSYNYFKEVAGRVMPSQPEGGYISATISNQLVARAMMYALGEVDYNHARTTVEYTLKYLENPHTKETYSISMYKDYGTNAIQCGALVYDWCYDVLTESERKTLADEIMALYTLKEDTNGNGTVEYVQHCRPDNVSSWSEISGYAVGQPLIYTSIAATALYDYNKETFYDVVMPKIQGNMAKVVKMYGTAGALSDGSISYTREYYTYYILVMFQRLGASAETLEDIYGNQLPVGYKMLYARLPYGAFIRQGDDFYQSNYVMNTYTNGAETTAMGLLGNLYGDEYLRFQYEKVRRGTKFAYLDFLTLASEVDVKLPDDLPLAYETKEPRSEILARTSWQDGITSKTVSVFLNMNERRTGDHDHGHVGEFQLYYKGPLTMPGGIYLGEDWGKPHWAGYLTRTSSANCMLLVDPSEVFSYSNRTLSNDGSQRYAKYPSGGIFGTLAEHQSEVTRWATTENTYVGPNKNTPAFSYIKGDLTKAYSESKMQSYKRGMVFMDTFNDTYPGVLVVFDRMVSKNKDFTKKWLLQSVTDPIISGNKITIKNTNDGANGKLVNTTILPENINIEKVGGIDKYFAGGVEYPAPAASTASEVYRSGYRAEIMPATSNEEDIFLNAMFVTDADGNAPDLPMIYENTNEFVGVTTLDRTVLFSKSGDTVSGSFSVNVRNNNGGGKMLVLITDVANGKWKVSGNGSEFVLESVKGDSCLTFSAAPGTYSVTPVSSSATITSMSWEEEEKEKLGDFVFKYGSSFVYLPHETYVYNDTPYISAETAESLGVKVSVSGNSATLINMDNKAVVTAGDDYYTYNGFKIRLNNPAIIHNGTVYIPPLEMMSALGVSIEYSNDNKILSASDNIEVNKENYIKPVSASGFDEAGILCDGVRGETVSFTYENYPYASNAIVYYLGETPKDISSIVIPGVTTIPAKAIYASIDGVNYYKLEGDSKYYDQYAASYETKGFNKARYLKFKLGKCTINEIAVYGTDSNDNIGFLYENVKKFDLNSEFVTTVYLKEGFNYANLYAGDELIYSFEDLGTNTYNVKLSPMQISAIPKGGSTLRLVADYNGTVESIERDIEFVELDSKQFINETFNESAFGQIFKSKGGYYFSRNAQNVTESLENGAYKLAFNKSVTSSSPFIYANGFAFGEGIYEINLDAYISSKNASIGLELRTKEGSYPASGPGNPFVSGVEGNVKIKAFIDTLNSLVRVFVDDEDSDDYYLLIESDFSSESLGQIRFTVSNTYGESYILFDNFTACYHYNAGGSSISPSDNKVITDENVKLSAYAENADKVVFCVNDSVIKSFNNVSNGFYEYETSFEDSGVKNFDVYVFRDENVFFDSQTFHYNPSIKRNAKKFAGPFTTKTQTDGNCWINATNASTYFTGRVVFEGDMLIPTAGDLVYFELGAASDYNFVFGGTNYITLFDALGYSTSVPLFGSDGKVAGTDFSYEIGTPMHIKYVCDTITDKYELYINGEFVLEKSADAGQYGKGNLAAVKIVGCKVRTIHVDQNGDGEGCPTFSNVSTYQEVSNPRVLGVHTSDDKQLELDSLVVCEGTDSISVKLSETFESLDSSLVGVTQNGETVNFNAVYDKESGILNLYGLELTYGVAKLTISADAKILVCDVSGSDVYSKIGKEISTDFYVGNNDGIFVYPISIVNSENGTTAYLKYINSGMGTKEKSFVLVEYEENEAVKNVSYKTFSFKSKTSGLISEKMFNITNEDNCRIMILNSDLSPFSKMLKLR